jgi:hypothetical protein
MKPSMAYSTEIASQKMKVSSINNMKNQPKKWMMYSIMLSSMNAPINGPLPIQTAQIYP